jgi:hypothetical protein
VQGREYVLRHLRVVLAAFLAGTGVGTERGERQQGARNTEKVDPSTNRRNVCNATMVRLVMRPGVVMRDRERKPGVERMGAKRQRTRRRTKGQGGPTLLMSSSREKP